MRYGELSIETLDKRPGVQHSLARKIWRQLRYGELLIEPLDETVRESDCEASKTSL